MATTVSEVRKYDSFSGSWKGRAFFWTLTQATRVLTISVPSRATARPGVFPNSPTGAGFDEWRRDAEKILSALKMLEDFDEPCVATSVLFSPSNRNAFGTTIYRKSQPN
ncbi:MAG TPA: hypothetical protein VEK34_03320 [Methylocella sp.]|nr:hypothetical protein [Methylocella sp.]